MFLQLNKKKRYSDMCREDHGDRKLLSGRTGQEVGAQWVDSWTRQVDE